MKPCVESARLRVWPRPCLSTAGGKCPCTPATCYVYKSSDSPPNLKPAKVQISDVINGISVGIPHGEA